jgi:hypothetical protein
MTACFYLWRTATRLIAYVGAGTCRPKFDQAKVFLNRVPHCTIGQALEDYIEVDARNARHGSNRSPLNGAT